MNANVPHTSDRRDRITTSYILWLLSFVGFAGMHRLYNGKIGTGLLWFLTWGVFGFGQFVDLFLVPDMVDERQLRLMAKHGLLPYNNMAVATQTLKPSRNQVMLKLLKAAQQNGGQLSMTEAVMATELSFVETQEVLTEMLRTGYVSVDNHPTTGVVIYRFHEL